MNFRLTEVRDQMIDTIRGRRRLSLATLWQTTRGYLVSVAGVILCTVIVILTPWQERLATVVLFYLITVIASTLAGGLGPGVLATLLALFATNYFLEPPIYGVTVVDPFDYLVALFSFLVVAVIISHLLTRLRAEASTALQCVREARLSAELMQAASEVEGLQATAQAVVNWAIRSIGVEGCAMLWPTPPERLSVIAAAGTLRDRADTELAQTDDAAQAMIGATPLYADGQGDVYLPLVTRNGPIGVLWLATPPESIPDYLLRKEFLPSLSRQIGLVVERAQLHTDATETEILRRSDEVKSALLSTVSHELRTPLTVIRAAATTLLQLDVSENDGTRQELARSIDEEAHRLHRLVGNLLDISRIESGALKLETGWYDLGELLREALSRQNPRLGNRHVELDIPEELPPVEVDYLLIDRVIVNLLENAARYTSPDCRLNISVQRNNRLVQVTVADEGPGIPDNDLPQIFQKFHQIAGRKGGIGLGLPICKAIIETHGGEMWAESPTISGQGLAMHFTIPLDRETRSEIYAANFWEGV